MNQWDPPIFVVIQDITENKYKSHRPSVLKESKNISHRLINMFIIIISFIIIII